MYRLFENPLHLVILLVVVLIIFGAGKLPGVGSALGQSIKEFKKATVEPDPAPKVTTADNTCESCHATVPSGAQFCPACGAAARPQVVAPSSSSSPVSGPATCAQCGAKNATDARFCAHCGTAMGVHAG
jgi:sec-independent protein translocase protein TatA